MNYYRLEPSNANGPAYELVWPMTMMPSIVCPGPPGSSGHQWGAGLERIRIDLPDGHPLVGKKPEPLQLQAFEQFATEISADLGVQKELLKPGIGIGHLYIQRRRQRAADFELLGFDDVLISVRAKKFLEDKGFSGWRAEPVRLYQEGFPSEQVFELAVERVGEVRVLVPPVVTASCPICGHHTISWTDAQAEVIQDTIPDVDLFRLPQPFQTRIYVQQRVWSALHLSRLTGYRLTKTDLRRPSSLAGSAV